MVRDAHAQQEGVPIALLVGALLAVPASVNRNRHLQGDPAPHVGSDAHVGDRAVRTRRWLLRYSVLATIVGLALVVEGGAFGRDAAAPVNSPACTATRIRGFTENRTGLNLKLLQLGHGVSDVWCDEPEDDVRAHSSDRSWLIGDIHGTVDVHLLYRLDNGDEIRFTARLHKPKKAEAGCSFRDVVRARAEYECLADVVASGSEVAFLRFIVRARNPVR